MLIFNEPTDRSPLALLNTLPIGDRFANDFIIEAIAGGYYVCNLKLIFLSLQQEKHEKVLEIANEAHRVMLDGKEVPRLHLIGDVPIPELILDKEKTEDFFCLQVISYWKEKGGEIVRIVKESEVIA